MPLSVTVLFELLFSVMEKYYVRCKTSKNGLVKRKLELNNKFDYYLFIPRNKLYCDNFLKLKKPSVIMFGLSV